MNIGEDFAPGRFSIKLNPPEYEEDALFRLLDEGKLSNIIFIEKKYKK